MKLTDTQKFILVLAVLVGGVYIYSIYRVELQAKDYFYFKENPNPFGLDSSSHITLIHSMNGEEIIMDLPCLIYLNRRDLRTDTFWVTKVTILTETSEVMQDVIEVPSDYN